MGSLKINNLWTGPDAPKMYLWLSYKTSEKPSDTSTNVTLDGIKINSDEYVELTKAVSTLSWDQIVAGNLGFGAFSDDADLDKILTKKIKYAIEDEFSFFGFIEFTHITNDAMYVDLSNVDGVGLLCGLSGLPTDEAKDGKAGYNSMQTTFASDLLSTFDKVKNDAIKDITIKAASYKKIVAPGKSPANIKEPWGPVINDYYDKILQKDRAIQLTIPNADNGNWRGQQLKTAKAYKDVGINELVAVTLSATFSVDNSNSAMTPFKYEVYIAAAKWNADVISQADAQHAVWVRTDNPNLPGFGDVPTIDDDPNPYGKLWSGTDADGKPLYGYDSMHLNVAVSTDSSQPFPLQSLALAISRLCLIIQNGCIKVDGGILEYPTPEGSSKEGGNQYNDWILDNSNSYGQPYADGQKRVLFRPLNSFELDILSPSDANTDSYFSPGGGFDPHGKG